MDESGNKFLVFKEGVRPIFVIFLVAIFFIFIAYKFGNNSQVVTNNEVISSGNSPTLSRDELLEKIKHDSGSEFFGKYIDKMQAGEVVSIEKTAEAELTQRTKLPEQIVFLNKETVGNSFAEKALYLNKFEEYMVEAKKKGVFSESLIFSAQAENFLPLSDYDKATILRNATEYEIWANKILDLETPRVYENKSLAAAEDIFNAAYILRKIVEENDRQIYVLWIGKYVETIFDILATRYVK